MRGQGKRHRTIWAFLSAKSLEELLHTKLTNETEPRPTSPRPCHDSCCSGGCAEHFTLTSFRHSEPTIRTPVLRATSLMTSLPNPSTHILSLIQEFIDGQNGLQSREKLIASLVEHLNNSVAHHHTPESVRSILRRTTEHASKQRASEQAYRTVVADHREVQKHVRTLTKGTAKHAKYLRDHAHVITAFKQKVKPKREQWTTAEERLADSTAALQKRSQNRKVQRVREKEEAKEEKRLRREEEKKAREEKAAAEKAAKLEADEKKKEKETELKAKRRETQTITQLTLKAKAMDFENERREKAERDKVIDAAMLELIQLETARLRAREGKKRQRDEEEVESEEDKENIAPADE